MDSEDNINNTCENNTCENNFDKLNLTVRIGIIGKFLTGKSTLLNSFFGKTYSQMKSTYTTLNPQVYHVYDKSKNDDNDDEIKSKNKEINEKFNKLYKEDKLTQDNINETHHYVKQIMNDDFKIDDNCSLELYDIPGINYNKEIFINYIKNKLQQLDIILFVLNINDNPLNSLDENNILKIFTEYIKNNHNEHPLYIITILNKCDNILLNKNSELELSNRDEQDLYNDINKSIMENGNNNGISKYCNKVHMLSSKDLYITRAVINKDDVDPNYINKMGENLMGKFKWNQKNSPNIDIEILLREMNKEYDNIIKLCGYTNLIETLNNIITKNYAEFYKKRLNEYLENFNKQINNNKNLDYNSIINELENIKNTFDEIDKIHNSTLADLIIENQKNYLISYINDICQNNISTEQINANIDKLNEIKNNNIVSKFTDIVEKISTMVSDLNDINIVNYFNEIEKSNNLEDIKKYIKIIIKINEDNNDCDNSKINIMVRLLNNCKSQPTYDKYMDFVNLIQELDFNKNNIIIFLMLLIENKIMKLYNSDTNTNKYLYNLKYLLLEYNRYDLIKKMLIKIDNLLAINLYGNTLIDLLTDIEINMDLENEFINYIANAQNEQLNISFNSLKKCKDVINNYDENLIQCKLNKFNKSEIEVRLDEFDKKIYEMYNNINNLNEQNKNIMEVYKKTNKTIRSKVDSMNMTINDTKEIENKDNNDNVIEILNKIKKDLFDLDSKYSNILIEYEKKVDNLNNNYNKIKSTLDNINKMTDVIDNLLINKVKVYELFNKMDISHTTYLCKKLNLNYQNMKNNKEKQINELKNYINF